nr:Zon4B-L [Andraca theae]
MMLKSLLILAVMANIFYIVSSTGDNGAEAASYSSSSSSSSKTYSSSSSSATSYSSSCSSEEDDDNTDDVSCGGDPNAMPGCDKYCRNRCPSRKALKCSCPKKNSCQCKDGYVFDYTTYKCVRPKDCPPICGDTEEYSDCTNGGCRAKNCSQIGKPIPCIKMDPKYCIKGCLCKEGYLRTDDGVCVPEKECPLECSKPHQVYNSCPVTCPPQTCASINHIYHCPLQLTNRSLQQCKPDCVCEKGYFKNLIEECISKDDCLKCTGPHEYFSCGVACDNVCATLSKRNQTNCDIKNIMCNKMCYCEQGYARDNNNTCIPISECNACGPNEVPSDCVNGGCDKRNCTELGQPDICRDPLECTKGCVCETGYLRNDDGVCVPINECPSCGGDPNAKAGCGVNCNRHCSDIGKKPGACSDVCQLNACDCKKGFYYDDNACITLCYDNACDCKKGYYYDDNTGKCVRAKQCTPVCSTNEVYSSCVQGQCGPKNCTQLGKSVACPKIDPKYCIKGCICTEGYLRADNGTCIPKENCPSCGGDRNARAGCGVNCNKRCSDIGKEPGACIKICYENACDCKDNYYLDENTGKCVLPKQCSSINSTTTPAPSTDVAESAERLREGNIKLSLKMLSQLLESQPGVSVVSSAISVLIALGQLTLYAVGETLTQLLGLLNLRNKDEIKAVFPELVNNYAVQMNVTLALAVKCYGNEKYPFSIPFIDDSREYFRADVENIDFSRNAEAADTINKWVENKTHNLIQNLVNADMFSPDTRLTFLNAIYFLGNWQHSFNSNLTENKDFYITPNKTKSIPTMCQQGRFNYGECDDLDAQILELPYKGGNMSFIIWLPRTKDGLSSMVQKLQNTNLFSKCLKSMNSETVKMYIPVMDILTDIDLAEQLKKFGVTKMFDPKSDGFKGMLEKPEPVYVSNAVQKAKIKVDEKGTEAAVATAVIVTTLSAMYPPPKEMVFNADHPFAFNILLDGNPVFTGAFVS